MNKYEQQVTIVLTQDQATCLRVALSEYERYVELSMQTAPSYKGREEIHPNSCRGLNAKLLGELEKASLGDKSTSFVSYKMVEKKAA